jgi:hypothetical protein
MNKVQKPSNSTYIFYLLAIWNILSMLQFKSTCDKFHVDGDVKYANELYWTIEES